MSLICGECEDYIVFGTPLHVVQYGENETITAICSVCLSKIPESERVKPESTEGHNVTIYTATSKINGYTSNYSWSSLEAAAPRFCIHQRVMEEHLARIAKILTVIPV